MLSIKSDQKWTKNVRIIRYKGVWKTKSHFFLTLCLFQFTLVTHPSHSSLLIWQTKLTLKMCIQFAVNNKLGRISNLPQNHSEFNLKYRIQNSNSRSNFKSKFEFDQNMSNLVLLLFNLKMPKMIFLNISKSPNWI